MRALVIAHGHPRAGIGGGELAAFNLYRGLAGHGQVEAAWFLARTGDRATTPGAIVPAGEGEFLWRRDTVDWFRHRGDPAAFAAFAEFLRRTAPDAVFVHHFAHIGIELFGEIRRVLPRAAIVATLHDFAAICHNGGLMTKTGFARAPCERASPDACHACFPERSREDFAGRREEMLLRLAAVDRFVSPSAFLKERYVEWGLDPARVAVIANGLEPTAPTARRPRDGRLRLGFFGQAREAKGLDILLAALHRLAPAERAGLHLAVNGSRLDAQDRWYRELIERLRVPLVAEGVLDWPGGYARSELSARMAGIDFAVVPSTWWENAPIVVQEAFAHGVPVIGANHGGIAEMVRNGVDGLLFAPRDAGALADLLRALLAAPERREALARGIRPPSTIARTTAVHVDLALCARSAPAAEAPSYFGGAPAHGHEAGPARRGRAQVAADFRSG